LAAGWKPTSSPAAIVSEIAVARVMPVGSPRVREFLPGSLFSAR
jgi:hypothetical protein